MSSDGSPILIDLLDSLSSINKRLNLIETALSVHDAEQEHGHADPSAAAASAAIPQSLQLPVATAPQTVAQRYGQPPPPPYRPCAQSATPPSTSTNNLLSINHIHNHAAATSAAWASGQALSVSQAVTARARRRPYPKRSSQLLRLKNMHAKDMISDDGAEYEVDTSDSDVHMKNSEEGGPYEVEYMDTDPAVKDEMPKDIPPEAHAYRGERQPTYVLSPAPNAAEYQPGPSTTSVNTNNLAPVPPVAEGARLEALPEGFIVTGRATLQEELDSWTIPRGYSMRINGTRSHGRRQKIRMVCFRGGRSRLRPKEEEQEEERQREELEKEKEKEKERERLELEHRSQLNLGSGSGPPISPVALISRRRKPTTDRVSKKCECPFRFELVEICPAADEYAVHYTNDDHMQHNHAAADLMLDPRARKLPSALKAEVDQWLRGNSRDNSRSDKTGKAWTIAKIQAELQKRGYGHVLDFDLRNRKRALLHKERVAQQKGGQDGQEAQDAQEAQEAQDAQEASAPGECSKASSAGSVGESSASNTPNASGQQTGRGRVVGARVCCRHGLVNLVEDLLGQDLAQLDTPLVKRVDVPDGTLSEGDVLVIGDQGTQLGRADVAADKDAGGRAVAQEHLVGHELVSDAALGADLIGRLADHEGLGLCEVVGGQHLLVDELLADGVVGARGQNEVSGDQLRALVDELEEGVLGVGAGLAEQNGARGVLGRGAVRRHRLAVGLHGQLLQVGREAVQVLVKRSDKVGLGVVEVRVPDAQQAGEHGDVLVERRLGAAEVLVHGVRASQELVEVVVANVEANGQANGAPDRVAAADPGLKAKHVALVDAELGNLLLVGGQGNKVLGNVGNIAAGLFQEPGLGCVGVGGGLGRRERLGGDQEQRGLGVGGGQRLGHVGAVNVADKVQRRAGGAVVLEGLGDHDGAQVGAANADVDNVSQLLAGVAGPGAAADLLAELLHVLEHVVDAAGDGGDLDAVDLHGPGLGADIAQSGVVDGTVLGKVDLLAGEHALALLGDLGLGGELGEQRNSLLGQEVLAEVEQDVGLDAIAGNVGGQLEDARELVKALGVLGKGVLEDKGLANGVAVLLELSPGGQRAGLRHCVWSVSLG
ncbi:hypothetical protein F503_02726 [Ophiostoma piceae UAMH 11346]|uniref:Uncharacterized protein n=1 Tax=Ophiostoma piceae (strain UAMH 11346) TaxID=1262450 RepID=S3CJI3_OPHP1|nr:hypothetical protein F503_02726 [Ophiostoma piceae UAMH 11346]